MKFRKEIAYKRDIGIDLIPFQYPYPSPDGGSWQVHDKSELKKSNALRLIIANPHFNTML